MIRPLGKQLVVKRVEIKAKTSIVLLEGHTKPLAEAADWFVEAIGGQCELGLKKGDKLVFRPEQIMMVPLKDYPDFFLVPESFVIGVDE